MRVTSKGQVTIPLAVRKKLGIHRHCEVEFEVHGNTARLVKVPANRATRRGAGIVARLKGTADVKMSTEEILALTRKSRKQAQILDLFGKVDFHPKYGYKRQRRNS